MADYSVYGEPATEWIDYSKSFSSPTVVPQDKTEDELKDIENLRRERLAKVPYPRPDVHIDEIDIPTINSHTVSTRLYRPKYLISRRDPLPLYIHLHGGGWHYGTLDTEEPYCMNLCSGFARNNSPLEIAVLNVNYHHTPEFQFPSQLFDAWAAFNSFAQQGELSARYHIDSHRIIVGGTSAGASLAIAITIKEMRRAQKAQEQESPRAKVHQTSRLQGLIISSSPTVHPDFFPIHLFRFSEVSSQEQFRETGILPATRARHFLDLYLADSKQEIKSSELVSPLLLSDDALEPALWPRTSVHVAGCDVFRDEGILFAKKLQNCRICTTLRVHQGYPHAFERFPTLEESVKWRQQIVDDIKCSLGRE